LLNEKREPRHDVTALARRLSVKGADRRLPT
jgi:hypothetical protein